MSLKRNRQSVKNPIGEFLKTFCIGCAVFIVLIAVASLIVMNVEFEDKILCVFVFIASALSAFSTGLIASLSARQNRLLFGLINILTVTVVHFLVLLCFNNADLSTSIYLLFPISITAGLIGSAVSIKLKK